MVALTGGVVNDFERGQVGCFPYLPRILTATMIGGFCAGAACGA